MQVIDEETYLSINGAHFGGIGEPALHCNSGSNSEKSWHKIVLKQYEINKELCEKRDMLRAEYQSKVEIGEIRPLTKLERLTRNASGHPDNESTQAAIRLLEKYKLKNK